MGIIRWSKVWRDLWIKKTQTVLVILAIAVGIFGLGTTIGARILVAEDLNTSYLASDPSSAMLLINEPFDDALVRSIRRMDRVRDAEGRRNVLVRVQIGPDEWQQVRLDVSEDYADLRMNHLIPQEGASAPAKDTMLLERRSLGMANAEVGQTLLIETPSGRQRQLQMTGVVHDINKAPANLTGEPIGYINFDTLESLGYPRGFNELHLLIDSHDQEEIKEIAAEVEAKLSKSRHSVFFVWVPEPGNHPANNIIQPVLTILGVLGGFILLLSGFLVSNTISAILIQHTRQIGIMKSIGAESFQIVRLYLGMILFFGLFALLSALPLSTVGAYALASYVAQIINFDIIALRITPQTLLLQLVMGIALPLLVALWPVLSGSRITVREALISHGGKHTQVGNSWLDQLLEQIRFLPGSILLSLRNTLRRKIRLALTLASLIVAGAMFITVFTVRTSLFSTLDQFAAYWSYDISVEFNRAYRTRVLLNETMSLAGVRAVEFWDKRSASRVYADGDAGTKFDVYGLPADSNMIQATLVEGRWLLPDDQNAIVLDTEIFNEEPDLKIGDIITLNLLGREHQWQVVGIVKPTLSATTVRIPTAYINYPYYSRVTGLPGRANSLRLTLSLQKDPERELTPASTLEQHLQGVGLNVLLTRTSSSQRQGVEFQFNVLLVILAVMAALLVLVGMLGLMGSMSLNVIERVREIGVMRAIGAENYQIMRIFIVEGIFIGMISWPPAVLLAWPMSQMLSYIVGIQFTGLPLLYTFSTEGAAFWLIGLLILSLIASYWPAQNAAKLTVRDVLNYE